VIGIKERNKILLEVTLSLLRKQHGLARAHFAREVDYGEFICHNWGFYQRVMAEYSFIEFLTRPIICFHARSRFVYEFLQEWDKWQPKHLH
jgi:hypothetical protein